MSTTILRRLVLATLLSAACSDPPAPAVDAAPVAAPTIAKLPIGRTLVFELDWTVDAGFDEGSPMSLPMAGGLHLVGDLRVQAIGEREGGTLAAIWFDGLDTGELTINREPLALESEMLVGPRAWFVLDADGGIAKTWFAPEAQPLFRHVMGGVLARLDLRGAAAPTGPQVVPTAHGLGNVAYVRDGDTTRREVQSFARFDALGGIHSDAPEIAGTFELTVDADGVPLRIAGDERASASDEGWAFGAHDRFHATRVRIDDGAALIEPELAGWDLHDPAAAPDYRESERVFAQGMAGELVAKDIALAMHAQDGGLLPSGELISQATGLLRGWPDEAWSIAPEILAARGNGRQLGFDVLSSAGTPEAQQVMCELLARDDVRSWDELPLLVGRFAFVRRPTSATVHFALAMHEWARERGDERLAGAMLYPLGSLARNVEHTDPWLAELLHTELVDELAAADELDTRLAAIAGLGNHGRADDRGRLLPLLGDDDDRIRAGAVVALRHLEAAEVTDALVIALRDPDRAVATRALDVLEERWHGADGAAKLAAMAAEGAHNPAIEYSMATKLGARIGEDPSVRVALDALAARTEDRELAYRIAELVAS